MAMKSHQEERMHVEYGCIKSILSPPMWYSYLQKQETKAKHEETPLKNDENEPKWLTEVMLSLSFSLPNSSWMNGNDIQN